MLYNLGYFINLARLNYTSRITYSTIWYIKITVLYSDCFLCFC